MTITPRLPSIGFSGKDDAGVKDDFMSRKADFEQRIKWKRKLEHYIVYTMEKNIRGKV